jgi:polysaccharide deacetylase 2 family uncharacterized protein YibQ
MPVLAVLASGAAVLQVLGPPVPQPTSQGAPATAITPPPAPIPTPPSPAPAAHAEAPAARIPAPPPAGAAIAAPDPALLEPAADIANASLPRIAADGRMPMRVYAAGYDPKDVRPRVALMLADIGMREQDSEEAIQQTPAAVSLAVNPYAIHPEPLLASARQRGHETLVSIPMEPEKYPLNDPGNEALLTGISPAANGQRLEWALSRIAGYVGATGALGALRGERFAASEQMKDVFDELNRRGLLYVDPRTQGAAANEVGASPPRRAIDLIVDEPAVGVEIDAKLARLERIALERGVAIGLAGRPSPVTTERIVVWTRNLPVRGLQLVPVSAVVVAPVVEAKTLHGAAPP